MKIYAVRLPDEAIRLLKGKPNSANLTRNAILRAIDAPRKRSRARKVSTPQ